MLPLANAPMLGAVPPFDPSQLTGQVLWTRSDLVTAVAGHATVWPDKSGNGNNIIPQLTTGPTIIAADAAFNNFSSLSFSNTNAMKTAAAIAYGLYTLFIVTAIPAVSSPSYIVNHTSGSNTDVVAVTSSAPSLAANMFRTAGTGYFVSLGANWAASATANLITSIGDGTVLGATIRLNGVAQTPTRSGVNAGSASLSAVLNLFAGASNLLPCVGKCAELIVYNRVLSGSEISQVETYAKSRYAIS